MDYASRPNFSGKLYRLLGVVSNSRLTDFVASQSVGIPHEAGGFEASDRILVISPVRLYWSHPTTQSGLDLGLQSGDALAGTS